MNKIYTLINEILQLETEDGPNVIISDTTFYGYLKKIAETAFEEGKKTTLEKSL